MPLGNKITSQILIELALSVAGEHDEDLMVKKTLNLYMRKLNCFLAAIIFLESDDAKDTYLLPFAHKNSDDWKFINKEVFTFFKNKAGDIYIGDHKQKKYYGFEIPSYGIVVLGRAISFEYDFLRELKPIIDNLGKSLRLSKEIKKSLALNKKLSLLEAFVNNSKDSFQAADIHGNIVYLNYEACRKLGVKANEDYNINVADFEPHFTDKNNWHLHVNQLREKQQIVESKNFHVAENKEIIVEVNANVTEIYNQEYVVAISRNITERKQAEYRINELNEIYNSLLKISTRLINGNINEINVLIKEAFSLLSKHLGAIRIYLYEFSDTEKQLNNVIEWYADSERETGILAKKIDLKGNDDFISQIFTSSHIVYKYGCEPDLIKNIKLFNTLESTTVIIPVLFEEKITGFAGIDSLLTNDQWNDDIISVVKISLNIISSSITRHTQNKNLADTKNFYETILNELPNDLAVFDEQHRYLFVNPEGIKDKITRKWIIGKTDFDYFEKKKLSADKALERRKYFLKATNDKCKVSWNDIVINKHGDTEVVTRNLYPIFNEDGTLKMMIGYGVDTTNLFNMQKKQNVLLSIVENIPATIIYYANNNKDFFINDFGKKQLGISAEEDLSWLSLENLHNEISFDKIINEGIKTVNNNGYWRDDVVVKRKDNSSFFADEIILRNNANNESGIALIITDISEKVKALDEVKSLASFPLENPNPVLRYDIDGNLLFSNAASSKLTQLLKKQYINKLPAKVLKQIRESILNNNAFSGEIFIDKHVFRYNIHPNKIKMYANFYAEDITERKLQEDKIRQTDILLRSLSEAAAELLSDEKIEQRLKKSLINIGINSIAHEAHIVKYNKVTNEYIILSKWQRVTSDESIFDKIYESVFSYNAFLAQLLSNNTLHINSNANNNLYSIFDNNNIESFSAFSHDFDANTAIILLFHFKGNHKKWNDFEIDIIKTYLDYLSGTLHRENLVNELHEKQLIQKTLLDASPDNIMLIKSDGTIVEANYRYKETLNIPPDEIIGKNIKGLFSDKVSKIRIEQGLKALTTKTPVFFEDIRDGYYFETNVHPVLNENNDVIYIATYARDITHRKITENEIKIAKQKLESILNEIQDVLWSLDIISKKYIFITPSVETIFGYSVADFEADYTTWEKMIHPDDKHFIDIINENVYKHGSSDVEYRIITKPGNIKWIKNKIKVIYDKGVGVRMDGYVIDITSQKTYEKEIKESEERYRIILDNSSEMIQTLNLEGKIVWTNRSWKEKLGVISENVEGQSITQFFNKATLEEFSRVIPKVMNGEIVTDLNCTFLTRNSNALLLQGRVIPLYKDGLLVGSQAYLHDITKIKEAEKELEQLNRNLETLVDERTKELNDSNTNLQNFAYVISHDLKAPVRHTTMFTHMLKAKVENKLNEEELRLLNNISLAGDKMGKLIDGMLEFNKLGNKPLEIKLINTEALVSRIIEMNKALNSKLNINVVIDTLPNINADESLIEQVFANLISNAIKYSSKQELIEVEIKYEEVNRYHKFTVKDNGTGFDMKHSANMFNMFARLHAPGDFEGNGIGLANTKRIIERHKGTINFYSEPNKGATFYFTIPK